MRRVNFRWLQDAWGIILLRFRVRKKQSRVENEIGLAVSSSVPSAKVTASPDTRDQKKARAFGGQLSP